MRFVDDLLKALRRFDALRDGEAGGDVVNRRVLPAIAPEYATGDPVEGLGERLRAALVKRGIKRLYLHQADAVAQALRGGGGRTSYFRHQRPAERRSRFKSRCSSL